MVDLSVLPATNAVLNATALGLVLTGYWQIRAGNTVWHKRCMIAAFVVSTLFLVSYLTYRFCGAEKKFTGHGAIRPIYFFILISHVSLAALVPFLAARTLYLGLRGRREAHRRIARVTLPIWIYTSLTGILVYFLLFQWYRPSGGA
jgi:uncharacterized membrane protein YozB (DUF420 family)